MRCQWGRNECHAVKGELGSAQSFINGYKASWVLWNSTNSTTFFPTTLFKMALMQHAAVGQGSCAALLDEQMAAFVPNKQILLLHVTWFLRSKTVPSPVWYWESCGCMCLLNTLILTHCRCVPARTLTLQWCVSCLTCPCSNSSLTTVSVAEHLWESCTGGVKRVPNLRTLMALVSGCLFVVGLVQLNASGVSLWREQ